MKIEQLPKGLPIILSPNKKQKNYNVYWLYRGRKIFWQEEQLKPYDYWKCKDVLYPPRYSYHVIEHFKSLKSSEMSLASELHDLRRYYPHYDSYKEKELREMLVVVKEELGAFKIKYGL